MSRITSTRTIGAPLELVFRTVAKISEFSKAVPAIVKVEFLSEVEYGLGAKFRETRIMKGREASTVLEVTEFVDNQHIRLVADEGGAIWDSIFSVEPTDDGTLLKLVMEARPYKLMPKLMTPLIIGMIRKALEGDMDAVKTFCENAEKPGSTEHEVEE